MKKLNYLIGITLFIACSPSGSISVKNVQDITIYGDHSFVYSLPRTRLAFNVTAIRNYTIPGKYSMYAGKYLGIKDVPADPTVKWEINKVMLNSLEEPDPEYFFSIETENTDLLLKNFIQLKDEGFILKVDSYNPFVHYFPIQSDFSGTTINNNPISLENNGIRKVYIPVDLPVGIPKTEIKTEEQKVQETANFIFKIRKRRFKLLAGDYDSFPETSAMETSIRELNRLEQEYLSLFIGKTYTDTIHRTFYFIPKPGSDADRSVICRFSERNGFEDEASNEGKPLIMELADLQFTASLDQVQMPKIVSEKGCVLYRIPDKAIVHIYFGSIPVLEGEIRVFQYGSMVPYCINIENN